MEEKGDGAIINIASIAGTKGMAGSIAYSTSKNAMTGWSEAIHDVSFYLLRYGKVHVISTCTALQILALPVWRCFT